MPASQKGGVFLSNFLLRRNRYMVMLTMIGRTRKDAPAGVPEGPGCHTTRRRTERGSDTKFRLVRQGRRDPDGFRLIINYHMDRCWIGSHGSLKSAARHLQGIACSTGLQGTRTRIHYLLELLCRNNRFECRVMIVYSWFVVSST